MISLMVRAPYAGPVREATWPAGRTPVEPDRDGSDGKPAVTLEMNRDVGGDAQHPGYELDDPLSASQRRAEHP